MGLHEIHFVKGWTRCLAASLVIDIVIKLGVVDDMRATNPEIFDSFCSFYAITGRYKDDIERIDANRGQTYFVDIDNGR